MIGKLIKQPAGYLAFIPNKFPGKIEIDMNKRSLNEMQYWAAHYLAKLDGVT
ncbi:MAG: cell filamentation protein Fic, partial [Candidatus Pacebacteria bacterium CG_4_10_14_3_um_filter_34_15]